MLRKSLVNGCRIVGKLDTFRLCHFPLLPFCYCVVTQLGLKYSSALVALSSVKEKGNRDDDTYNMVSKKRFFQSFCSIYLCYEIDKYAM